MTDAPPHFNVHAFRNALVEWFRREGKDYPWRRTTDPWHILVSELMLQQTTIPTVLGRYDRWMRQFPTPGHLAALDEQTLAWLLPAEAGGLPFLAADVPIVERLARGEL